MINRNEEEAKIIIDKVLSGESKYEDIPLVSPNFVRNYLEAKDYYEDEIETNGWQWDYWIPFYKDDIGYELSGSGYCGDQSFSLKIEEVE